MREERKSSPARWGTITSPAPVQLIALEESKSFRHAPSKANHPSCFPTQCRLMINPYKCNLALRKNNLLVSEFSTYFKQKTRLIGINETGCLTDADMNLRLGASRREDNASFVTAVGADSEWEPLKRMY